MKLRIRGQKGKPGLQNNLWDTGIQEWDIISGLTLQFRNKDYQFLVEAVNRNGFVGLDENQYSIFISLLTVTLDFEKQEQRPIPF